MPQYCGWMEDARGRPPDAVGHHSTGEATDETARLEPTMAAQHGNFVPRLMPYMAGSVTPR